VKIFSVITLFLILYGCGSSPSPVLPPVELTALDNKINITRLWKVKAGEGVSEFYLKLSPAVHDTKGYVVDYKGYLIVFNLTNGKVEWEKQLNTSVSAGLTYSDNKLLLGNSKGEVVVLDANNAEELWRAQLSSEILSAPVIAKGILVVKTVDGAVYGLNAENGKQLWVNDRSVPRLTLRGNSAAIINNDIVITASDSGKLSALTLADGKLLWETTISIPQGRNELERVIDLDVDPVISDDTVYTVGYQGRLAAVKISSGQLIWSRDFSSYSGLYVDAYRVYITDAEGQIWALNRYNGSTLWRQDKLLRRQLTAPAVQDDYVVVGDYDGYLHWIGREDGKLIARTRVNGSSAHIDDDESNKESNLRFSKWNNILVPPLMVNKLLLALDRSGHLDAYQIHNN
jgi:outer membrane protein assembly factor BamB